MAACFTYFVSISAQYFFKHNTNVDLKLNQCQYNNLGKYQPMSIVFLSGPFSDVQASDNLSLEIVYYIRTDLIRQQSEYENM